MPPEIFTLTEFVDDDRDMTLRIIHGRDLGGVTPESVEYDYNFIDYVFPLAGVKRARACIWTSPGSSTSSSAARRSARPRRQRSCATCSGASTAS